MASGGGRRSTRKSTKGLVFWDKSSTPPRESMVPGPVRRSTRDESQEYEARRSSDLTERELRLGKATWSKHVDPQPAEFRDLVFSELFRCHPEYEFYFMHMLDNEGRGSSVFRNSPIRPHMYERLVPKLKEVFDSLEEPAALQEIMTKLGLYHAKLRLTRKHMTDMIKVLISCVDKIAGYKLQKDEEYALDKCFYKAFTIAIDSMEQWARLNPGQSQGQVQVQVQGHSAARFSVAARSVSIKRVDSKAG